MFVYVRLLNGFAKPLLYKVPSHLANQDLSCHCVVIPLKTKKQLAFVLKQTSEPLIKPTFVVREIIDKAPFPPDLLFYQFASKLGSLYFTDPLYFYEKFSSMLKKKAELSTAQSILEEKLHDAEIATTLTTEQQTIIDYFIPFITAHHLTFTPAILYGVTGSGKTEVYKKLIASTIQQKKSVILMLPEVSLALRFQQLLHDQLTGICVTGFHSASTPKEKKALWEALIAETPLVIIGVHLPILLPISNLGMIIVDEEHDLGFEEKKHPKINSKHAALMRAQIYNIPIVLGSATPSLQTLYIAEQKKWPIFKLKKRFTGKFPTITKVLLTDYAHHRRPFFWISVPLEKAIRSCLEKKEQALIYINRRGYSFFVQCKTCGFIFTCPSCSVSLTSHGKPPNLSLHCHYCDYTNTIPSQCPSCKQEKNNFLTKGIGTQQAVEILEKLFPLARIARADLDTTKKKNWQKTLKDFHDGHLDILVGTKSIAKGYHFPKVTLVGILWADLNLHFPLYNASEITLQQLIQVAGRAGRANDTSNVIIQAMQDHPIFDYLSEDTYEQFAHYEQLIRQEIGYPPYKRLIQIEFKHTSKVQVEKDSKTYAAQLTHSSTTNGMIQVLGPALPAIHKIQQTEIRHLFIKCMRYHDVYPILQAIDPTLFKSAIYINPLC